MNKNIYEIIVPYNLLQLYIRFITLIAYYEIEHHISFVSF